MDWFDLLAVQGTLKSLFQHHSSKASILPRSAFFRVQLSHPYMNTGKTIALSRRTFVGKVMSLLLVLAQEAVLSSIQKRACLSRALSPVRLKPEEKAPGILEALWPSPSPLALSSVARGEASSLSGGLEGRGLGAVTPRARSPTHVGASACARSRAGGGAPRRVRC